MNPLALWTSMKAKAKMTLIICLTLAFITLVIAAAYTGNLDELIRWCINGQKD